MIKYIIETTSCYSDLNGNTYHFARITSTKTKNSLVLDVGSASNAEGLLFRLKVTNDWSEIYVVQTWYKTREWQRLAKFAKQPAVYEGNVTAKMVRALNRKAK
jgi:hypothetical protein|tara:strand:+ start:222 stop:530 length:309 start_codon:yes stop_codon:yes gene_type:complete